MTLKDKVVFVTGAAQGFGRGIALTCAKAGATLVVADIDTCQDTLAAVREFGNDALALSFDLTDDAACVDAIEQAVQQFGRIDGLVNNGALYGALQLAPFEQLDSGEWDRVMAVNVKGVWHMSKAVAPYMRQARSGSIVNISSNSAQIGPPFMCHYATSKAAVIGLSRSLATELGGDNIRVNAVCPGPINTRGTQKVAGDNLQAMLDAVPRARTKVVHEPEEIAGTVVFLLSDASVAMTGQTLTADGGMTTR